MKKYYQILTENRTADIDIYGEITSWPYEESDVSAYTLSKELQGLDVDQINVHINSYGGEVAEAAAIYNSLKNHKAKVTTIVDGFACSAASFIFMAGENRLMNAASLLMIHNAWTCASGNADELRKAAEDLEVINGISIAAYTERVNISEEELKKLMDEETWIAPDAAISMGFATGMTESKSAGASQSAMSSIAKKLTAPKQEETPAVNKMEKFFDALCERGKE